MILAPTINLIRDPRCGRSFEAFSEDPLLTGELALAWVRGAEDDEGILVTLKHLVGNECETNRHGSNVIVDKDVLSDVYLRPFEIVIRAKPDVGAIMMGYNSIKGEPCSSHSTLIRDVIRRDWSYEGVVMSDWFGTYKNAESLHAGLDLEMPGPANHRTVENVRKLLESKQIEERHIDEAAARMMRLVSRAKHLAKEHGYRLFTEEEKDKDVETSAPDDETMRSDAVEIGTAACVLLKNEDQLLPIEPDRQHIKRVVLIGEPAKSPALTGGGSAALNPHRVVAPLDAIRAHLEQNHAQVSVEWRPGCEVRPCIPDPLIDEHLEGKPIDFAWHDVGSGELLHSESHSLPQYRGFLGGFQPRSSAFEIRAEFNMTASTSGEHRISLQAFGSLSLHLSGPALAEDCVWEYKGESVTPAMMFDPRKRLETRRFPITAKRRLHVRLCYRPPAHPIMALPGGHSAAFRLGFQEASDERKPIDEAAAAAAQADVAIVFTATGAAFESEGIDRTDIALPCRQDELVAAVAKAAPGRTIVVNASGSAVTMPWEKDVGAILQAWFGGQEVGQSICNALFAIDGNGPSGRLPMTWPRDLQDHASFANFPTSGGHPVDVRYEEGHLYGHRWYEARDIQPLWWFGHGLSYTTFCVKALESADDTVKVLVENIGGRPGRNTVQVYALSTKGDARQLVGFGVTGRLQPDECETLHIDIEPSSPAEPQSLVISESSSPHAVLIRL